MATNALNKTIWANAGKGAILPFATLMLVGLMIVPVPSLVLDVGFITNIMISLAVLMVALNAAKPLDFSSFPTVLLFATLLRLSLNVASTRVVLVDGHEGPDAAGHVIEAFGHFLIGGDWAVGIFVFAILMIINLVVITKGAGRVSEVSARFTLDALPGKQMAIDADLNAGLLTPDEAKARRVEVATEADFYGSMDGASKFVKGDAVAGVLILVINILGGLILGVMSHGLSMAEAAQTYVMLAIGDALVAQIPALLLSIAAAAIVTRVSSPFDLSGQITSQFGSARAWTPVAAILFLLGVMPGMPHVVILSAAAVAGAVAWQLRKAPAREAARRAEEEAVAAAAAEPLPSTIGWDEVSDGAALGLEIGYGLIAMVDERKGAPLMARITGIRRQLSRELGFVVPMVRVRDNLSLEPNAYRITVAGVIMGEDQCWPEDLLALDSGALESRVEGREVRDPSFGLEAVWIPPAKRTEAVVAGYTVVDPATVIATHLNQIIANAAADLFGMDEAQKLLDALKEVAPQLAQGLTPQPLTLAQVAGLCRGLLAEGVPLKDFRRIAEAMVEAAREEADPAQMLEAVRRRIGPIIVQTLVPMRMPLPVVTLDGGLEALLAQAVRAGPNATHPFEPGLANRVVTAVGEAAQPLMAEARQFAIVTSPLARRPLARLLKPHLAEVPVLSFLEIPDGKAVEVVAVVGGGNPAVPAERELVR
ncbi:MULTISPECIES: flagellar biosynthesis protein FlhA [Sphingomonas]|uniref:Flagellar biosynthesis protein FlhA n=1 Tax=Edaphosphingomonas fennica TaxID=114404 RepID=A0A2T4I7M6_9SPHN|nr:MULTISPECIES: flagellar biosynthesis protein FlhA [Sphingomonas]AGH48920.1 flagellar biosynthesis protein FlhA [Sphingomonas sp. MM-1]PTD27311.1 flagellar biosynthesis protein FlhA [Sphingomonas fennica]